MGCIVLKNGEIWTADINNPWADCLVISEKNIAFVGSEEDAENAIPKDAKVIDLEGKMVIPAFLDSHIHPSTMIRSSWIEAIDFEACESMEDIMEKVVEHVGDKSPEDFPYVYAFLVPTELIEKESADKRTIDKYISDRPVLLSDTSYHQCIANSKMLELMEITKDTPYDETGTGNYLRYEDGEPNGIILERIHEINGDLEKMFNKINWAPPEPNELENAIKVYKPFNDFGICAIAEGYTENENNIIGVAAAIESGDYKGYFAPLIEFKGLHDIEDCITLAKKWKEKYGSEHIIVDTIKLFLDGTNEVGTGAYLEPVEGTTDNYGLMNISEEDLIYVIRRLNEENLSIQIHIVGDRAYRVALNAIDNVKASLTDNEKDFTIRVTLLHAELIHPDDVTRAAQKGVFVNVTPTFTAGIFGDAARKHIGEERYNSMFAYNDLIEAGTCVNFASDEVDFLGLYSVNPFRGIGYASTRSIPEMEIYGRPKEESKLSVYDLMMGYTINNAKGMGLDAITGSLEVGKMANLLVISKNIFKVELDEIFDIVPEQIYFEGEQIR